LVFYVVVTLLQGHAGQKGYKGDTGLPGFDGISGTKVGYFGFYVIFYEKAPGTVLCGEF